VRDNLEDDVYASVDLSVSMPKYRFPAMEQDPRAAYSVVHDELMLDGNSRQNLATFCQTWAEAAATNKGFGVQEILLCRNHSIKSCCRPLGDI
jgi:glutamate/tyrosine decarboxylase-like PLP-dependent enzyme